MKNNPQQNLSFEKAPKNEIDGVLQAYLFTTQQAVASASRALFPVVDREMRRMQENANKPVNQAPEVAPPVARPTATEMLAQVATSRPEQTNAQDENLLAAESEDVVADHLKAVDAIHAELAAEKAQHDADIAAGRVNRGDYGHAA
jgi:formate dehydrogenase maturation protein FdhE